MWAASHCLWLRLKSKVSGFNEACHEWGNNKGSSEGAGGLGGGTGQEEDNLYAKFKGGGCPALSFFFIN